MGVVIKAVNFFNRQRTRSHQAHFAAEDVPQLRQFVQAVPAQHASETGDPRVVADLEHGSFHLVARNEIRLARLGVADHRTKFDHVERLAVEPASPLKEEHRTGRREFDGSGDDCEYRQQEAEEDGGGDIIEDAFGEQITGRGGLGAVADHRLTRQTVDLRPEDGRVKNAGAHHSLHSFALAGRESRKDVGRRQSGEVDDDQIDRMLMQ